MLLRWDSEKGTAVIQYQGRPYLVALRHVRLHKGIYLVEIPNAETEDSLGRAMKHVEDMVPYKTNVIGWICKKNGTWITSPVDTQKVRELWANLKAISAAMTTRQSTAGRSCSGTLTTSVPATKDDNRHADYMGQRRPTVCGADAPQGVGICSTTYAPSISTTTQ